MIFKSGYAQIIPSFFKIIVQFKKKKEISIFFRFFGQDDLAIEQFIFEFNQFCQSLHPCWSGQYGFTKQRFDGTLGTKNFSIKEENMAISIRNNNPDKEIFVFETLERVTIDLLSLKTQI